MKEGQEAAFERIYGPAGDWCRLFSQAGGYLGSDLYKDEKVPCRYLTVDRWASQGDYQAFHLAHGRAYRALDELCTDLSEREACLGAFRGVA